MTALRPRGPERGASSAYLIVAGCLLAALCAALPAHAEAPAYGSYTDSRYSQRAVVLNWNTAEGRRRLARAINGDFFRLAHHYQPQANPLYCGIASSVIVLNALRADRGLIPSQPEFEIHNPLPLGGGVQPYPLYSQATFLNAATEQVKPRRVIEMAAGGESGGAGAPVYDPGLRLRELHDMLATYGLAVELHPAADDLEDGAEAFRGVLRRVLAEDRAYLVVNYRSDLIGQAGGGHISPLGAYDADSDSVLILDVSGYMNPWVWAPVADLYAAMHTLDGDDYRGYLVVREGRGRQATD